MAKQNIFDKATDTLKARLDRAFGVLSGQFKGANPYRQKPISNDERIYNYYQMLPHEQELRGEFGDYPVDRYKQNIESLIRRRGNA